MDQKIINNLISVNDSFTAVIDIKAKKINSFYLDDKLVKENISFEEYANMVCKLKNFTEETGGKLLRFLSNFNTDEDDFSFQMTCQYTNSIKAIFVVIGASLSNGMYVLSIRKNKRDLKRKRDQLTKLYTPEVIHKLIEKDIKDNKKILVMLIDIDDFKQINNIYGFMFGDIVLIESAAAIKRALGNNGFVARIIGDQFIAYSYLNDTKEETILKECALIRNSITNASKNNVKQAKITATMGAVVVPDQANNLDDILLKANKALTRGKYKGGNNFVIYSSICEDKIYEKPTLPNETLMATSISPGDAIVAGVYEILNNGNDINKNIYDCFNLIGSYFQLDRVSTFFSDEKNIKLENGTFIEWTNPYYPELNGLLEKALSKYSFPEIQYEYKKKLSYGILKISQIDSNKNLGFVYKTLKETKTSAIFLVELSYLGKSFGLIRFDNCHNNRFWNINDTSPLLIISKIISMTIYKNTEKDLLEKMVSYDKLTGLYNYSKWRDEVESFISTTDNYPNYAIISLNILGFTNIVRKYGMNLGDNVLKAIANKLNELIFKGNINCRISNDNFLIFIANKNESEILEYIKILQKFIYDKYNRISIKLLAGIYTHKGIEDINTCIDNANIAVKNANAVTEIKIYDSELEEYEHHKNEIEIHMKDAVIQNEFLLYLQPKINTETGEVVGAEALTRWNFKFQKLLFPNDFIPIFEETGFITALDYCVFENVCKFQRKIIDEGYKPITISVNVSRYQKDFSTYLNNLNMIREKYNIDPKYLEIELTESMYNENTEAISNFINDLHKNGYYVSMDDFGSGYSNLASLAKLDFDIIKLDKTFCSDMTNKKEQTILSFIMKLVKELRIDVLCEGVETKELVENLKELGCYLVQGYFYSKPIPSEDFIQKFLKK